MKLFFLTVIFCLFIISCAGPPTKKSERGFKATTTFALLPLNNHTNDLEGPAKVRITDAGQLSAFPVEILREKIPADFLVYGELLDYSIKSTG
ncbi:MAG: hypothetical protein HY400_02105 [Elusimicrobia bacterium]|nr:hypothetical protein [Elusimicrobiota bacterium]